MERVELLVAARTIRVELSQLLPNPWEALLAARVEGLIDAMEDGLPVDDELLETLTGHEALRRRLDALLPDDETDKSWAGPPYQELPGHGGPVDAVYLVCPKGDYRYPVLEVGEVVPPCPVHRMQLVTE